MAQLAHVDQSTGIIVGWYTEELSVYTNPPPENEMVEVPDDVWNTRAGKHVMYKDGNFIVEDTIKPFRTLPSPTAPGA